MRYKFIRIVSLLLSLVVFTSGLPVFAEEDYELVIAEMEQLDALPTPTPMPTEVPEEELTLVLAETPVPEPMDAPAMELSLEPTVVASEVYDAAQSADEPDQDVSDASTPETEQPTVEPEEVSTPVPTEDETPEPTVSSTMEASETEATAAPEASVEPEVSVEPEEAVAPEATPDPEEEIVVAETIEPSAEPALIQTAQELADAFGLTVEELAVALEIPEEELSAMSPEELTSLYEALLEMQSNVALLSLEPEFEIDENNRLVSYLGEGGDVVVPEGVVSIGAAAFKNCTSLTSVSLPASVVSIEAEAFAGCSGLADILIPDGVEEIPDSAFRGCSSLKLVQLPSGLKRIGSAAFEGCSSLNTINMPSGLQSIGNLAFSGASALAELRFEAGLETIGESAFYGCGSLVSVGLPDGLVSIGAAAFGNCSALREIVIPNGTKMLPGLEADVDFYTFADCGALTAVTLPEGLKVIGSGMFAQCASLVQVNIPDTVTAIDAAAFAGCVALESLKLPAGISQIAEDAFENCALLNIQLSKGSYAESYCADRGIPYTYFDSVVPNQIIPGKGTLTIGVQEKVSVADWTLLPAGTIDTVTYSSKSDRIATVSEDGLVTGKTIGTTVIYLHTAGGLSAEINVEVKKAPTSIKINGLRNTLGIFEDLQLGYTLSDGSAGSAEFSSSNNMVVDITTDGWLIAINEGKAKITAKTYNGKTKTVEVQVKPAPTTLTISDDAFTIGVSDTRILKASIDAGSAGGVYYTSLNPEIASVTQDGTITALQPGTTSIRVETYNHIEAVCAVTVVPAPEGITLTAERQTIGIGEKLQLQPITDPEETAANIKYKSSSTKVASVNASGVVTAKAAGKTTITATTYNNLSATYVITVKKAPTSVNLVAVRKIIGVGEELQLGYTLSSGSTGAVSFKSLNEDIATVTADGLLKGEAVGVAEIEVRTYNNKYKRVKFEVKEAPAEVIPAKSEVLIGAEDSWVLGYTLNEGSAGAVTYTSDKPDIVTVDANGKLNALQEGEAIITLEAYNKVSSTCKVTVVPAPEGITLTAERQTIGIGEKLQLQPITEPAETVGTIKYKSSSTKVASVNASGVVTASRAGKATITATTYNNLSATYVITVKKAPSSVNLVAARKIIGVGEEFQLGYTLSSGSTGAVSFKSLNEDIATVTADGLLKGEAVGIAEIEVRTYNNKYKRVKFEVKEAPAEVIPAKSEVLIGAEDSWVLGYTLNEGSAGAVTYTSDNTDIVTVDAAGKLNALQEGEAIITLEAYNKVSSTCKVTVVPAPEGITLTAERQTIGIGEKLQLQPITEPAETVGTIKYKSSSTKVASVNANGVVTASRAGKATITATTYNNLSTTYVITVKKAPSSVNLVAARKVIGVGEEFQLGYTLSSGSTGAVSFKSLNEDIATVTVDGLLKGEAVGVAEIEVRTYNNKYKRVKFEVKESPAEVIPAKSEVLIGAEDSWVLGYTLNEGSAGAVTYTSDNPDIVTVDADGKLNALQEGEAIITLEAYNKVSSTCKVTVVPAPEGITLTAERQTIGIGEKLQLQPVTEPAETVGTIKYKSSSTKVASVNASGVVTASRAGKATITATTYNNLSATYVITVKKAPTSVNLVAARKAIGVGEEFQLGYTLSSGSTGAVSFKSLNEDIATVTADGLLKGEAVGIAEIEVRTYNNKYKRVKFEVKEAPAEVIPAKSEVLIGAEDSWVLGYTLNEGSAGAVTYTSDNPDIVTVDADGKLNALQEGEAIITLEAYNKVSSTCKVTVVPAPEGITLTAERQTIGIGEKLQLQPVTEPAETVGTIKYKSSSTKVASVDASGVVTARRAGKATITATTYNNLSATYVIIVKKAPTSVNLVAARKVIGVGEEFQLGYTLSSGSTGAVSFKSLNEAVATVTADGLLKGEAIGIAEIEVRTYNNKYKRVKFEVKEAPAEVIPAKSEVLIGAEDSWVLGYTLNEGSAGAVTYTSDNPDIVTVDANGKLNALQEGEAIITLEAYNKVSSTCKVTVVPAPEGITLTAERQTIGIGEKLQLQPITEPSETVGTIKYKSSSTKVASVNASGVVTASRAGKATITATTYNNLSATYVITVKKAPTSVNLVATRKIIGVGEEMQLGYSLSSGSEGAVSFKSLNESVATVTADGLLKGEAVGVAEIEVRTYNNKYKRVKFEVKEAPSLVLPSEPVVSIAAGDSWILSYKLNDNAAGGVEFTSSNTAVASVDPSGRITAIAEGTADILLKTYNDVQAVCYVTVVPAPTEIDVSSVPTVIGLSESVQLEPRLLPGNAVGTLKYSSSKSSVVAVNASGVITGKKVGTAKITIKAYNDVAATVSVRVAGAPSSISISTDRNVVGVGEVLQFEATLSKGSAGNYHFETSDENVIIINRETGEAFAAGEGEAVIRAITYNNKKAEMTVRVLAEPTDMTISPAVAAIGLGDTVTFSAAVNEGSTGIYKFASSNPEVAAVDAQTGVITTYAEGETNISVTAYNGVSASSVLQVLPEPEELKLLQPACDENGTYFIEMIRGETYQVIVDTGAYSSISCSYASEKGIVKVSGDGLITPVRTGEDKVTVTSYNGRTIEIAVDVLNLVEMYPEVRAIKHAMGSINGEVYSNSREAFLYNYAQGNRLFEIDLSYTSDGELVLWHSWTSNQINSSVKKGYVPSLAKFESMLVFDKYDSLTYRDLLELMDEYPDVHFVMDTKITNTSEIRKQFTKMVAVAYEMGLSHVLDRMVIMVYSKDMYKITSGIYPFTQYVLTGYKYFSKKPTTAQVKAAIEYSAANGIDMISMWDYWWKPEYLEMAHSAGLTVQLHTVNSAESAKEYVLQGVDYITTDHLSAKIIEDEIARSVMLSAETPDETTN